MRPQILALATALPAHKISQEESAELFIKATGLKGLIADKVRNLFLHSAISSRYSVFRECYQVDQVKELLAAKMSRRNELYQQYAPELAVAAGRKALDQWGVDPQSITHVISVSCTGLITPGLEFYLMDQLGLRPSVCRLAITLMGCFGAFKGISVANAYAKEDPHHRILVVCTELCSLHIQPDLRMDNLVANALFADGAAAMVIGGTPSPKESALYEILSLHSHCIPHTQEHMKWNGADEGLLIRLAKEVPQCIKEGIAGFCETAFREIATSECDWAIHPGGKLIVESIEQELDLRPDQTDASWKVLSACGNMSSSTIVFILEKLLQERSQRNFCAALGFGPGLSIESMLCKRHEKI